MADVVNQVQGTVFRPQDQQAINKGMRDVSNAAAFAQGGVRNAANSLSGINTSFSGLFNPSQFNTNFQTQGGLDARSQALFNQYNAQNQAGAAAQQRQLQRQFAGRNPGLANILGQQGQQQAMLASQPAFFQAGQQQEARIQQERQLQNQALLQSTQQQAALQDAGNQALFNQASTLGNLNALYAQLPQSSLASIFGAAQGMGQQYAATPDALPGLFSQINAANNPTQASSNALQQQAGRMMQLKNDPYYGGSARKWLKQNGFM